MPADKDILSARLAESRILVVGDLFLDEYLEGRCDRLSREAPVPVVELTQRTTIPGGAANPARNIASLGGEVLMLGLVGDDEAGSTVVSQLQQSGVDTSGVVVDPERATITKTRVVAYRDFMRFPQHLARIDRIERSPIGQLAARRLADRLDVLLPQADAVLFSDYQAGTITFELVDVVRAAAAEGSILATVDAQGNLDRYRGFSLIKCNRGEAEAEYGRLLAEDADYEQALTELLARLRSKMLVITRGREGMSVKREGTCVEHLPAANQSEVFDVTGAGDTVIAVLTMALAAGMDLSRAAHLANAAAGVVVRRLGNVVLSPEELQAACGREEPFS